MFWTQENLLVHLLEDTNLFRLSFEKVTANK